MTARTCPRVRPAKSFRRSTFVIRRLGCLYNIIVNTPHVCVCVCDIVSFRLSNTSLNIQIICGTFRNCLLVRCFSFKSSTSILEQGYHGIIGNRESWNPQIALISDPPRVHPQRRARRLVHTVPRVMNKIRWVDTLWPPLVKYISRLCRNYRIFWLLAVGIANRIFFRGTSCIKHRLLACLLHQQYVVSSGFVLFKYITSMDVQFGSFISPDIRFNGHAANPCHSTLAPCNCNPATALTLKDNIFPLQLNHIQHFAQGMSNL